jgi:hypothetical protein
MDEIAALVEIRDAMGFAFWKDNSCHSSIFTSAEASSCEEESENWVQKGWGSIESHRNPQMCTGITVDRTSGKVILLDLANSNLAGEVPGSIVFLTVLQGLILSGNKIKGCLPDLSKMGSLLLLDVSDNPELLKVEKISRAVELRKSKLQKKELASLIDIRDAFQANWKDPEYGMNPGWKEAWGEIDDEGLDVLLGDHFGARADRYGCLQELKLSQCNLIGKVPHGIQGLTCLTRLRLDNNQLTGTLPDLSPLVLLQEFLVNDNPDLAGVVTVELLCRWQRSNFSGCKQRWQCSAKEKDAGVGWMQFPFIVGVSFSSMDIGTMTYLRDYCNIEPHMLVQAPAKGGAQYEMTAIHGSSWCAWQEVWLRGLEKLVDRCVYVLVSEKARTWNGMLCRYLPRGTGRPGAGAGAGSDTGTASPCCGTSFEEKFLDASFTTREDFEKRCRRDCFDPSYALQGFPGDDNEGSQRHEEEGQEEHLEGERATSILDWERRQLLRVAVKNRLLITFLKDGAAMNQGTVLVGTV